MPALDVNALNPNERRVFDSADYFTLVRGTFRKRTKVRCASLADAEQYAAENPGARPWMLYAVTADGSDAHLANL